MTAIGTSNGEALMRANRAMEDEKLQNISSKQEDSLRHAIAFETHLSFGRPLNKKEQ